MAGILWGVAVVVACWFVFVLRWLWRLAAGVFEVIACWFDLWLYGAF